MKFPGILPELGFYYHYKHNPAESVNNYAYELVTVAMHTEDESYFVIYRPLYETEVYRNGKISFSRPLEMFMETVTKDGKTFPRFSKVTDQEVINKLEEIKQKMYRD